MGQHYYAESHLHSPLRALSWAETEDNCCKMHCECSSAGLSVRVHYSGLCRTQNSEKLASSSALERRLYTSLQHLRIHLNELIWKNWKDWARWPHASVRKA